jgi:uncharacterized protein YbjT (DUF2867 family)
MAVAITTHWIVGVDRMMFGYFESKRAAEEIIAHSGIPWTTLRATQFHDLVLATARGMAKMPLVLVPSGVRFQPIDTGEVAARLVELALGDPAGLVPHIEGPKVYGMDQLIRGTFTLQSKHRPTLPRPPAG